MNKVNFCIPFTGYSCHSFLSDFAAVHTYITETMLTGESDKNLGWYQEMYYFLFGTLTGCNSFLQNMEQSRNDPAEDIETVDFCMKFCGYAYDMVRHNMENALIESIDRGYPVIAKMKNAEFGPSRVLIGYDKDKIIVPACSNEQSPPPTAPIYEEIECLYIIRGIGRKERTLLDGFRNIEKSLKESIQYGAWANSAEVFDYFGKNMKDTPFEEIKSRFEAVKNIAWNFDRCHNFAETFRKRIIPDLRDIRLDEYCKQIDYWYKQSLEQQWQLIALHDCRDWSERRWDCLEAGMCTCVNWTMESLAKNDEEVLKVVQQMIEVLEAD
ncbi:MAG: hypothetical protein IJ435_09045 [Clostridia bacterium]|nr:hypothetical protein [Clostridia bacterium]